jgi:hypothetical protein
VTAATMPSGTDSPTYATINGVNQVLFGGGYGRLVVARSQNKIDIAVRS